MVNIGVRWKIFAFFLLTMTGLTLLPMKSNESLAQGALPSWRIDNVTVTESDTGGTLATFVIVLSRPSTSIVSINWATSNGTAKGPFDYTPAAGKVILAPGETSQTVTVPIAGDLIDENVEQFYVFLSLPVNSVIGLGRAVATITDNDPSPQISVENLRTPEGNNRPSVAVFRVRLSAPSGKVVKVTYATKDTSGTNSARAGEDYEAVAPTQIAFNVGSTAALARVVVNGDFLHEADENFLVTLSNPLEGTLSTTPAARQAIGTILNDDSAPALSVSDVLVNEIGATGAAQQASFTISLSAPSGQNVSVKWGTVDGSAKAPADYNAGSGTISFAPGETKRSILVPVQSDTSAEASESFYVLLTEPQEASIGRARGTATILDGNKVICPPLTRIRFFPRSGYASRLFRGRFYGSNAGPHSQLQFITSVSSVPVEGQWNEIILPQPAIYRFLKFEAPNNSFGGLAEIEFLWNNIRIDGTPLGSPAPLNSTNTFAKAFDGDVKTFFEGEQPNEQWVALDLGAAVQAKAPKFNPAAGTYNAPQIITITSATPEAKIRISRGGETIFLNTGGDPTRDSGEEVNGPLILSQSQILSAIAYTENLAASPAVTSAYRIENTNFNGMRTFHIGNSLTFGMDRWLQPLSASAGKNLDYHRFTHSGAATEYLWTHPGDGYGDTHYAEALSVFAPFNHIFTQPFAGMDKSLDNEAEYSQKFYDLARQNSPNMQAWLYAQWPGKPFSDNRSQGKGSAAPLNLTPAATWEQGVTNHLKFIEAVRAKVNQSYSGKPVLIVPTGSALVNLKTEIDAGRVPGLTNFWADISADGLHLNYKGNYMVALVFYACLFKESPEGKVGLLDSGLTAQQAAIFQRIAWQTASQYPLSGIQP